MPPIVAEVIRLLWIGSSSGWFGLGCPAHCSASGPLLISVFVSGFGISLDFSSYPFLPDF